MNDSPTTTEAALERNLCDCVACLSVPLSVLALEVDIPLGGWGDLLDQMGIRVTHDHIGRDSISALAARRLIASRRREAEIATEKAARCNERLAARYRVSADGVPVVEGATPYESMVATGKVVMPSQEFAGGRPRPRFLEEEIAEGDRALAEKQARAKERAVQRMNEDLR